MQKPTVHSSSTDSDRPDHRSGTRVRHQAELVRRYNAYPKLVQALISAYAHLQESRTCKTCHPVGDCAVFNRLDVVLRELGELK